MRYGEVEVDSKVDDTVCYGLLCTEDESGGSLSFGGEWEGTVKRSAEH